jgi:alpha 1,3-glucosidase
MTFSGADVGGFYDSPDSALLSRWFDYRSLKEMCKSEVEVNEVNGRTAVFVKGGSIVPIKTRIRKSIGLMGRDPLNLIVSVDGDDRAEGELYVDDGETFEFVKGNYIHRKFVFDGKVLKSIWLNGNGLLKDYDVIIEQIQIAGLVVVPRRAFDGAGNEFRMTEHDGIFIIHKPYFSVGKDFNHSLET